MSRKLYIQSILTGALILLMLAGCSGLGSETVTQQQGQVYQSPLGFEVATVDGNTYDLEANEVAKILDIQRWKFTVTPSDTKTKLNFQLELHQPDGESEVLSSFTIVPVDTGPIDTLLAFYPLQGSLFNSDKVKYYIEAGGGSTQQILDNPFKEFSGYGPSSPAKLDQDGKFLLVRLSKNGSMGADQDTLLYFRVRELSGNE